MATTSTIAPKSVPDSSDPAWEHGTCPDETKRYYVKCNYCLKVCKGGITRFRYHLGNVPKSSVAPCLSVPPDVKKQMFDSVFEKKKKKEKKATELMQLRGDVDLNHSEGDGLSDDGEDVNLISKSLKGRSSKQSGDPGPIDKFCKLTPEEARKQKSLEKVQGKMTKLKETKRDRACEYIAQWFYEASISHNTTTLPSFHLMLEAIEDYGRNFRGPTPYELGGPLLKKRKSKVLEAFTSHKQAWELTGCSIMTDAWTDRKGRGIMNLVVHSAYGVCFIQSIDCSAARKDGKYIFQLVDKCIEDIGVENVVQVVTDNARPNETAASYLRAKRSSIYWNGCAAHYIDLMLEDIGSLPNVKETITKARSVTVFLYAHTRVLELMRRFLGRDLVRSGVTRFATAYLNLKSLQDNKKELAKLFRSDELDNLGYLKKEKGKNAAKVVRSDRFWKGVGDAVNYFEALVNVLRRMDSDVPAMGFLYGCLLDAKKEIAKRFNGVESSYKSVLDIIDKRWDLKLKTPLHLAGYFLNPYYYYSNKNEMEMVGIFREGVISCVSKLIEKIETQDTIIDELQLYEREECSFGKDIAKRQRRNKDFDPAKWWLNHGTSAPNLRILAVRILSLTCSSSACERNWSAFEQVHSKKQARLLHGRLNDLVFVKFNSKLAQKKEIKNRDPIVLSNVDVLEDDGNEWVRIIEEAEEMEPQTNPDGSAHVVPQADLASQSKRKRKEVNNNANPTKKKKIIPTEDEEEEFVSSSSSEDEDIELLVDSDHVVSQSD